MFGDCLFDSGLRENAFVFKSVLWQSLSCILSSVGNIQFPEFLYIRRESYITQLLHSYTKYKKHFTIRSHELRLVHSFSNALLIVTGLFIFDNVSLKLFIVVDVSSGPININRWTFIQLSKHNRD